MDASVTCATFDEKTYARGMGYMISAGSRAMQGGASGVKAEPRERWASVRCKQACGARAEQGQACKKGGKERGGEGKKEGKEKTERAWISRRPCQGQTSGPWHRCERHPVQASARSIAEKGGAAWPSDWTSQLIWSLGDDCASD